MSVDSQGNEVGKLFVGGLHQFTTNDSLKSYFSKFGEIEESMVMMDNRTGRSRGFGYVKFKSDDSVDWVLRQKPHLIDDKEVDPKRCNVNMKGKNRRSLKVFVGGVAFEHDENTIRNFFLKYGKVTDVNLLTSPNKQRHRGFAFVGFDDEEVVKTLISLHYLNLDGKQVEIKAMKPPTTQRMDYSTSSGGSITTQGNGRAVRGSRGSHFNAMLNNNHSWSQWPPNWSAPMIPHSQPSQMWPPSIGWGNSVSNNQQTCHSGAGPEPPLTNLSTAIGNWPPTNGWIPQAWGPQVGPTTANRIHSLNEEPALYHSQQHRKAPLNWDSLCLASLAAGAGPVQNSVDALGNPMDSWNHSVAANAALCHLSQSPNIGLGGLPGDLSNWDQGDPSNPTVNGQWTVSNSAMIPGPRSNFSHSIPGNPNMPAGFLNEPHQNGSPMAAMAAAMTNPVGCPSMPHWASGRPVDPGNLKLSDSIYGATNGCNLSAHRAAGNQNPINLSHPDAIIPSNAFLSSDWCATALANNNLGTAVQQRSNNSHHMHKR